MLGPSLDILGGQAVQIVRLLEALHASGEVQVEFCPMNPRLAPPLRALQRIKYVRTIVTLLRYLASLPAAVLRADVLHVFSPSYWAYLLGPLPAMLVGRLLGRAVVLNYHSGEADDHLSHWPLSTASMRWLSTRIAVPSGYLERIFHQHQLKTIPISNIVPAASLRFRQRAALAPKILSNRNLEPMYNVSAVLDAFSRVQATYPEAQLTVAGDGSQRDALINRAQTLGLRNVRFLGRVEPNDMAALYDDADIYLNASLIDNQPLSLVEAMLSGLPVVSTNSGGIPWVIEHGETGWLVDQHDSDGLAAGALKLLADPAFAQRLATAARELAVQTYSASSIVPQWLDAYREAVTGHGITHRPAERAA